MTAICCASDRVRGDDNLRRFKKMRNVNMSKGKACRATYSKFHIIAHLEMVMVLSTIAMHEVTNRPATLAAKRAHVTRGGCGGCCSGATATAVATAVETFDAPASMDFEIGAVGEAGSCAPEPARLDT